MGLIGSVAKGTFNWVTSPVRVGWNGLKMAGNVVQMTGNVVTGNEEALKRNAGDFWDATKGAALASVQTATGPLAGIAIGTIEGKVRR